MTRTWTARLLCPLATIALVGGVCAPIAAAATPASTAAGASATAHAVPDGGIGCCDWKPRPGPPPYYPRPH
jgi:hypothetical protein